MLPRPTTPARVIARMELAQHAAMARAVARGDHESAARVRASLAGWAYLRDMLARDEPHSAWLN